MASLPFGLFANWTTLLNSDAMTRPPPRARREPVAGPAHPVNGDSSEAVPRGERDTRAGTRTDRSPVEEAARPAVAVGEQPGEGGDRDLGRAARPDVQPDRPVHAVDVPGAD